MLKIKPYTKENIAEAIEIRNDIVEDGIAFPQKEPLDESSSQRQRNWAS